MNIKEGIPCLLSNGSTWAKFDDLKAKGVDFNGTDNLIRNGEIVYSDRGGTDMFTLPKIYEAEHTLAKNILRVRNSSPKYPVKSDAEIKALIDEAEKKVGITLCDEQRNAVSMALQNQLLVLTGGPGTGKTSTLNCIDYALRKSGYSSILYTAPTGKAARRISESTGKEATTLHKVIGVTKDKIIPTTLNAEVVIVDEVSMLDTDIANIFFQTVPQHMKVIFVGDIEQLPSVGSGAVLRDMIKSEVVPVARLLKTFRQGADSLIITNLKNIRDGIPELYNANDFQVFMPNEKYSAVDELTTLYLSEYKRLGGNDDLVLLTPFRNRKYESSAEAMNIRLQKLINPCGDACVVNSDIFRVGDPVIQLENRKEVANGDVGRVIEASSTGLKVKYVDCEVTYARSELESGQLSLAYAMSIHKSQGSEYKSVITCLLNENGPMLKRNLLYTAVSRAKKNCFLVCENKDTEILAPKENDRIPVPKLRFYSGNEDAVNKAIMTEASRERNTMLSELLQFESRM